VRNNSNAARGVSTGLTGPGIEPLNSRANYQNTPKMAFYYQNTTKILKCV
jgi:hypothetical protein